MKFSFFQRFNKQHISENGHFSIMKKLQDLTLSPLLPGGGRTRAWHHHGSGMPTFPRDILIHK